MLFNQYKSLFPKCKVAQHIRFPKVSPINTHQLLSHEVQKFYDSSVHITQDTYYVTLYYMIKDAIYFHSTTKKQLMSIISAYDYKNGKYFFWKAGTKYKPSEAVPKSWYCVKAPNGNVYIVYIGWPSRYEKALYVYNLTKDNILHYVTYNVNSATESKLKNHADQHSYILANSFVIIYKIIDIGFSIYVVDLVSEKVDTFSYTLHDYLKQLLDIVDNDIERKRIIEMLSEDFHHLITNRSILLWDDEKIEQILDYHKNSVPFIKFLKVYFSISARFSIFKRATNILAVSFRFEKNQLYVDFTTGTGGSIEKAYDAAFTVSVPSDVNLLSKRYNIDTSYDISQSYPYYIYEATPNYIFTRRQVFKKSFYRSEDYVSDPELSYSYINYMFHTVNNINILKTKDGAIAQLKESYVGQEQKLGVYIVGADSSENPRIVTFIDLRKVKKFVQRVIYAKNLHSGEFVDVSKYVFNINVYEKIMHIIGIKKEDLNSTGKRIRHHLYLDEIRGLLYILILLLPEHDANGNVDCWLCKCSVWKTRSACKVITKLLYYNANSIRDFVRVGGSDVHLLELLSKIERDNISSYSTYERLYVYGKGFIVINNDLSIKIKDIRYNRISILQYKKQNIKVKSTYLTYSVYQDDFLICENFIETQDRASFSVHYPLLFTDLKLVESIQLK